MRRLLLLAVAFVPLISSVAFGAGEASAAMDRATASVSTFRLTPTENIFGAHESGPPPGSGGTGILPTRYGVKAGVTSLTFTAHGSDYFCGTTCHTGAGGSPGLAGGGSSDITDPNGLLGAFVDPNQGPVVGVFIAGKPSGPAPSPFNDNHAAKSIAPMVDQVFYIGAGGQKVLVPEGAHSLYLGFADANGFDGPAGSYGDNSGHVQVKVTSHGA